MTHMIAPQFMPWLERAADCAVMRALRFGVPTGASEPQFVAAVVLNAIPEIAMIWEPILNHAGLSATFSSVFCHQSPIATYQDSACKKHSCELADLLVVVDDRTNGTQVRRRAVLVQAKMAAPQGGKRLSSSDLTQLNLYSTWPAFRLGSGFRSCLRHFSNCRHPGNLDDCGRYGLIGRCPRLWHQQAPARTMPSGGDELGTFLARMVDNRSGYGREATGRADDWSRTVEELMSITFNKVFHDPTTRSRRFRGVSVSSTNSDDAIGLRIRGQDIYSGPVIAYPLDAVGFQIRGHANAGGGASGRETDRFEERAPGGGISLLRIEIKRLDER